MMAKFYLVMDPFFLFMLCTLFSSAHSMVYNGSDLTNGTTFDYIIVGCGIAGLVTSTRLTEDEDVTVLCLEAGQLDHYETTIQYPVYIGAQPPLFYEWGASTVPQTQLDGLTRSVPMGKGVGGGSLINGMIWNRGSQSDFDSWAVLTGDDGWSWSGMLPYFKRSESFTPKSYVGTNATLTGFEQNFNFSVHGFNGPVQVSYPNYMWPQSQFWFEALDELGVPKCVDPDDGSSAGGYFIPLDIDATNQTRSDARRAYYDPFSGRTNYNLAVGAQVTRILFDTDTDTQLSYGNWTGPARRVRRQSMSESLRATGVVFATDPYSPLQTVFASQSVILSAGAIHTSALLELSGIGDASILSSLNITVLVDNPGVGNNLQDHAMIHLDYHYANTSIHTPEDLLSNDSFSMLAEQEYLSSKTGPWTAKPSTAVAFPSLQQITNSTDISSLLGLASLVNSTQYLPLSNQQPDLLVGYFAQLNQTLHALSSATVPSHEILNDNSGGLDLSLMRPLSRGNTHITTTNAFTLPAINPNWLSHPLDFAIMERAMHFNQRLLTTSSLSQLQPTFSQVPFNPSPEQIEQILKTGIGTEYHYSGTAAMMPREQGGVVDSRLTVYGTRNLKVVDSSVFPIVPGGHLQAVVYAVAERGADLIKEEQATGAYR